MRLGRRAAGMLETSSLSRALCGLRARAAVLGPEIQAGRSSLCCTSFQNRGPGSGGFGSLTSRQQRHIGGSRGVDISSHRWPTRSQFVSRPSQEGGMSRKLGMAQARRYSRDLRTNDQFGELTEDQYSKSQHRFKRISAKEIQKVFGPGMDAKQGNQLLNTVQKQRVTGTLDANISGPSATKATIAKSLSWLRENYPLDEDTAIMTRLEREEETVRDWQPQQDADPENVYGESVLDQVRAKNIEEERLREEAEEAEEARREEEERKTGPMAVNGKESFKEVARPRKSAEWVEKYKQKALLSNMSEPPKPSALQTLFPTGLFVLAVVALCVGLAVEYEPPPREARLLPDIPPAAATVGTIIALNVFFFVCWKFPPLWRMMNFNMLMVPATPNPFSLIGNVFSHQTFSHLAANMIALWFIGTSVHDEVGRGRFLAIFLACGAVASYASLARFVVIKNFTFTSLGASGALLGLIGTYCTLYPDRLITIGILPQEWQQFVGIRADWIFWLFLAWEVYSLTRKAPGLSGNDNGAHLGGLLFGVVAGEALKRHSRARRKRFTERTHGPSPVT